MKKLLVPALSLVTALAATVPGFAGDGWVTALERHVRAGIVHSESFPFDYRPTDSTFAGFTITGERIHLENGTLTAFFASITGDDGTRLENVNAVSKLSLGGDFLTDPIRKAVEAFLAYTDMTAAKVNLAFTIAPGVAPRGDEAPAEVLSMPARDLKMKMRAKAFEMTLKSIIPIKANGTANYRPAEKKIDFQVSGASSGGIPIPIDLVFMTLNSQIHYPFVEVHKPYVTVDLGYFLEPAPGKVASR